MMAAIPKRSGAVSNLLFFRRSCAYRNAAAEMMRKARAMPLGSNRRAAPRRTGIMNNRVALLQALEPDMSDRRAYTPQDRTFDADNFTRCPVCQCWFDRGNRLGVAVHRGPLPPLQQNA